LLGCRWSAYVVDGVIKALNVEEDPSVVTVSAAQTILEQIWGFCWFVSMHKVDLTVWGWFIVSKIEIKSLNMVEVYDVGLFIFYFKLQKK